VDSTMAKKLLGTHWSMRVWREGELWGISLMCVELPHLNTFETMSVGVELCMERFFFGGRAKMVFRLNSTGDGFSSVCESEKFGKFLIEEKYFEEGVHWTLTCKGKSVTQYWTRLSRTEGDYIYEKGENVESYLESTGCGFLYKYIDTYKIHVSRHGNTYIFKERYGEYGTISNTLELDVDTPFYVPCDIKGGKPSCKAIISKTGVGKFTLICKTDDGLIEEWKFSFNDWGCVLRALEKRTGQTCKIFMRRFRDTTGTYKLCSISGFEKFGKIMGVSSDDIKEIIGDHHTKLVILDKGDGYIRHQLIRKVHPMDYSFKLNEQFSLYHPLMKEVVRCVGTVNRYTFCMVSKTSKGPLKSMMHFNDHFVTWAVSLPEYHVSCKMIFERMLR